MLREQVGGWVGGGAAAQPARDKFNAIPGRNTKEKEEEKEKAETGEKEEGQEERGRRHTGKGGPPQGRPPPGGGVREGTPSWRGAAPPGSGQKAPPPRPG